MTARALPSLGAYLRLLRLHQWAKNLLVFLPLLAGHAFTVPALSRAVLAFFAFSLAASSAYVINDLLDRAADRAHPRKRARGFASGAIPASHGPPLALLLLGGAVGFALSLPWTFGAVLALYVATTLAYSLLLKRKLLVDVIVLGGLYTLRVLGGVAALGAPGEPWKLSPWLAMFSLFLFLCLGIVKRCSELVAMRRLGNGAAAGRGYLVDDLVVLFTLGAAAGYGAVLVIALYIAGPEVQLLYRHPARLWLFCPILLYWVSRMLLLANRDELHDDPLVFAFSDRNSWLCLAAAAVVVASAI